MKYKTSDLSKILNVSSNTIRRFEESGYLNPVRDEENGYRFFGDGDVAKTIYISRYRKFGFSHEDIATLFSADMSESIALWEEKLMAMDKQIEMMKAIRHMFKDNLGLMQRSQGYGDVIMERECNAIYYVSYQKNGQLLTNGRRGQYLHQLLYQCPEIEYLYVFKKEDVLRRCLAYEEAIAIKQVHKEQYSIQVDEEHFVPYDKTTSVMQVVKLPINLMDETQKSQEKITAILYNDLLQYIEKKGYQVAGDMLGVKIGFSRENDKEMQYVLLSIPVNKN